MRVFVDTGAWIGMYVARDKYHPLAGPYGAALVADCAQLLTTDYIVDETVTRLRYDYGHRIAVTYLELLDGLVRASVLRIVPIDEQLFADAKAIFLRYREPVLSFTDCTSFSVLQRSPVDAVFGFDRHFEMMGHVLQPQWD